MEDFKVHQGVLSRERCTPLLVECASLNTPLIACRLCYSSTRAAARLQGRADREGEGGAAPEARAGESRARADEALTSTLIPNPRNPKS